MKKASFLSIILSVAIIFLATHISPQPSKRAVADQSEYLRIASQSTPFYKNPNDQIPLFYLPYTYYVKLLSISEDFYHVECFISATIPSIDGFVPKECLFLDGLTVSNPYPNLNLTSSTTAVLYADQNLKTQIQYIFPERNMRYYGSFSTEEGMLYYVGYNGKLGYIKESTVYPFAIPNHSNDLTFLPSEEVESGKQEQISEKAKDTAFSIKVLIIGCLMFAGIVALFVILKQRTTPTIRAGYYDENEYE